MTEAAEGTLLWEPFEEALSKDFLSNPESLGGTFVEQSQKLKT
jgi:hypothetical protein